MTRRDALFFAAMAALLIGTGFFQSWNTALTILNMGLISAVMAMGVNLQWGYAGLFNVGIMGFVALGGLGVVLTTSAPVPEAWAAGGPRLLAGLALGAATIAGAVIAWGRMGAGRARSFTVLAILVVGFFVYRGVFDPAVQAVEAVDPAATGYLGGLNLPVLLAWPIGGLLAAGAAWLIGKTALGLRSDYLAIATLGIAEILISILKNEDWLARGVKNVVGLPRPVPYEVDLQNDPGFVEFATGWGADPVTFSSITVKLSYGLLFAGVLIILMVLAQLAQNSPWGRMMRAIRDNEVAAEAMGKDVTRRHLQIFIIGSAVCGVAGAMMTTLDSAMTPSSYQPLRFTFLVWVMVIVGGSGNNFGAILGGILIWFCWVQAEPAGQMLANGFFGFAETITGVTDGGDPLRLRWLMAAAEQIRDNAQHLRLLTMGVILLLVLRFSPRGLIPER
ncbi:branched-chain amino acid ABC transporter permease [Actibacterium mucosum]|nr:branched-chain amino acid ABC transporter permease [Actibacterium mucosum]